MSSQLRLPGTATRRRTGRIRRGLDETVRAMRIRADSKRSTRGSSPWPGWRPTSSTRRAGTPTRSRYTRATLIARYHGVLDALVNRDPGDDLADLADLFAEDLDTPPPRPSE